MAETDKVSKADALQHSVASNKKVKKASITPKAIDFDDLLVKELGQFGRFQIISFLLVAIPIMMTALQTEYIFSAATVPYRLVNIFMIWMQGCVCYRCRIPECGENDNNLVYDQTWLTNAIPLTNSGELEKCKRYQPRAGNGTLTECLPNQFDQSTVVDCDGYVYGATNTVVYEFDLGCKEILRALAGTFNSVGTLLVLPIAGYVSDRWGRRVTLITSVFNLGLFGLIRAFSVNYPMYLVLQLLQTTFGSGAFSSAYIYVTEYVGPKYRVLTGAVATSLFALGEIYLGLLTWAIPDWRYMNMALFVPFFYIISYYWLLPESVRWLLSKKRYEEASEVLQKLAKTNKTKITENSMHQLMNSAQTVKPNLDKGPGLVKTIFKSQVLTRRILTTPIWWITTTFVYYGLSINSTGLSDNMHLNYILTSAVEIPAYFLAVFVLDRIGRKATLSCGYFLSATCNIGFAFISKDQETFRLIVFFLGKFGISVVFTSLYLYTSELYPTVYRHTLLAFSSMVGRVGSIVAPLTPPLMQIWKGLPSVLFGGMALLSGLLVLTQPETLGTKMPDTLEEAEAIGTPESMIVKDP